MIIINYFHLKNLQLFQKVIMKNRLKLNIRKSF